MTKREEEDRFFRREAAKGKTKPQAAAGRKVKRDAKASSVPEDDPLAGDCETVSHGFPHRETDYCLRWKASPAPQPIPVGHPEGSKALQALVDTVLRDPKAEEPREADCTTPETCGICHKCGKPEPHDCTVQVPRDLYERAVAAMDGAHNGLLNMGAKRDWPTLRALRSVLADLKALGGGR